MSSPMWILRYENKVSSLSRDSSIEQRSYGIYSYMM